jgi:exosortase/archaeosortase family protein
LAAIALWPLSAPIPPGTYTRLTLHLQLWVTGVVLHMLNLFGVPAIQTGNVIILAHTSVGVEEACSGVRSLISCIVAGLFFSATLVRRPAARVLLLVLAAPLALGMNLVRSLTLTLLANAGVDISGAWHDLTGFGILGVTAATLGGLALLLESRGAASLQQAPGSWSPPGWSRWLAPTGLALAAMLVTGLVLDTHAPTTAATNAAIAGPDLAAIVPVQSPGWEVVTTDDLHRFTSTLATNHLIQRNYARRTTNGVVQITIYLAWWPAGSVPVSLVESHTPEACWPGTGWVQQRTPSRTMAMTVDGRELPAATYLFFKNAQAYPQHTWYWHLNAGQPILQINALSPRALLGLAWHYGLRTSGEQLFVRISSNQPWAKIADEPLLAGLFAQLKPMGL